MPQEKTAPKKHAVLRTWLVRSLQGVGGLGLFLTTLGFFGQYDWRLDLLSHFREQYVLFFVVVLVAAICLRTRVGIILSMLGILLNASPFLPFYVPRSPVREGQRLLVLSANVQVDNTAYDRLRSYIAKLQPDIIVLEEVNTVWLSQLTPLRLAYPYAVVAARNDYSGMLMLSKLPLKQPRVVPLGRQRLSSVVATVLWEGKEILIIGTHPYPPLGARSTALRNDQIQAVGKFITAQSLPVVLVGDFNASPFSYPYRQLLSATDLSDCAEGFGYQATWQYRPFVPLLGISLDHCFHSPELSVAESFVGEDIGSDHRPIVNRISLSPHGR
jgi:endonuclease/exonuclease/phosphatase (EEP) superfamily protein YafD